MSNNIFKNYQVNMGIPFQVRAPVNFNTIRKADDFEEFPDDEVSKEEQDSFENSNHENLVNQAREEAELIIREANFEATRLIENTENELRENRAKVEEDAREKGYKEGFEQAQLQYEDLISEAEFIREHAKVEYKEVFAGMETDVVNTIMEVARAVIGMEISFNKEDVLYLVKQAFDKCTNKENAVLKVSTVDYEYLIQNKDKLLSMIEGMGELEIKKDPALKEGACIVETQFGCVDAGIQIKLKNIEEAFRQAIGK